LKRKVKRAAEEAKKKSKASKGKKGAKRTTSIKTSVASTHR